LANFATSLRLKQSDSGHFSIGVKMPCFAASDNQAEYPKQHKADHFSSDASYVDAQKGEI
jgi:hypothetical protein